MRCRALGLCLAAGMVLSLPSAASSEELPREHQELVDRGLEWVAKQQYRDGHWETPAGQFATAMTGIAGTTLLMEGSTIREGKYKENIRRAVDYYPGEKDAHTS